MPQLMVVEAESSRKNVSHGMHYGFPCLDATGNNGQRVLNNLCWLFLYMDNRREADGGERLDAKYLHE